MLDKHYTCTCSFRWTAAEEENSEQTQQWRHSCIPEPWCMQVTWKTVVYKRWDTPMTKKYIWYKVHIRICYTWNLSVYLTSGSREMSTSCGWSRGNVYSLVVWPLFCLLTLGGRDMSLLLFLWTRWSQVKAKGGDKGYKYKGQIRHDFFVVWSYHRHSKRCHPFHRVTSFGNHTSRISKPVLQVLRATMTLSQSQRLTEIIACIGDTN